MAERIGSGDIREFIGCHRSERTARTSEQNFLHFVVALADETLENGRMFAIDGQNRHAVFLCELTDEFACHDERFLVGEADFFPCADGVDGRFETRKAHHRREHHIDGVGLDDVVQRLPTGINLDVGAVAEQRFQFIVAVFVGHDHRRRIELPSLLRQQFHAVVVRQRIDIVAVSVLADDFEGLRADGAGRTENTNLFHIFNSCCRNELQISAFFRK